MASGLARWSALTSETSTEWAGARTILHIRRKGKVDKHDTVAVPEIITELLEDYISCRDFDIADPLLLNHAHGRKTLRLAKVTISAIVKQRLRYIV
jgi:hypothetical protein